MKPAKQIAVYFLLMITALPLFAFVFFIGQRQYLQWEMEEKLEKEQLTSIIVNAQDFNWYKEGKEIIVNGHLFDVEEIRKLNDGQLLITGLYDYQEQKLHKQMETWMHNSDESVPIGGQALIKWLSHLYDDQIPGLSLSHTNIKMKKNIFSDTTSSKTISLGVLTPPPRYLFL